MPLRLRALAVFAGLCSFSVLGWGAPPPPAVPGYVVLKDQAKAGLVAQGQVLLGELNCLQCHQLAGQKQIQSKGAPDLRDVGARVTPQYLRAFLMNPHEVRPGTTMPDIFHASDAGPKAQAVDMLVHFLASLGGPVKVQAASGNALDLDRGKALYNTVGCVACHEPETGIKAKVPSVPINDLARKTTVDALTAFLLDPAKTRPGGRMPYSNLNKDEAHSLAVYLLREQISNPQSKNTAPPIAHGLHYQYFENHISSAALKSFEKFKPKSDGRVQTVSTKVPNRRNENFALKLSGAIIIPSDGKYTFYVRSDDGSMLYIDGYLIVDNNGDHGPEEKSGPVELKAGKHAIDVTFYQGGGGEELSASWSGPGFGKRPIPSEALECPGDEAMVPLESEEFTVVPEKAQWGQRFFSILGCAGCHTTLGITPMSKAKALDELNLENELGCIGTQVEKGRPNYHISDDQRSALKAAIKAAKTFNQPLAAKDQVMHTMAAFNCYACHKRDKVGGPESARVPFFTMVAEFDMGEEGKIPPLLSQAGHKLKPEAIEQIVFEGKLHVRPVLATRMPRFSKEAVGPIAEEFIKADQPANALPEPPFSETAAKDGRILVGTKGLGCVNCHGVAGVKSLGMPATDLATVHDRIQPGWFHELLINPAEKNPATRMPQFWLDEGGVAVKDVVAHTRDAQIDAIWAYLSLGKSMALPAGLTPSGGYVLIPSDQPIVHRTFFTGVGPRAILVGFPENIHCAFDANAVRMAMAWKGKFFDASGVWEGRGGSARGPLGTDVINFPAGPSFAVLAAADTAWPTSKERNTGGKFHGYKLDKEGRPTFMYSLDGVNIDEAPLPRLQSGGPHLIRRFHLTSEHPPKDLYFLAGSGRKIDDKGKGVYVIDDKMTIKTLAPAIIRDDHGTRELVVPVSFQNNQWQMQMEMSW